MASQQLHCMLTAVSHDLVIPDERLKKGNKYMQTIFLMLQQYSRYKLSRCRLVGGVGKKTSISTKFDYDCVIYVNDIEPPFKELLDEWENLLTLNLNRLMGETKLTLYSIQFEIEGFEFDLLPAPNYAGLNHDIHLQAEHIWKNVSKDQYASKDDKISHFYSSGLSELTLEFMQKQSGFIHDLCRLAKFWNGTIGFDQYVSGRSSIIESLAVKAGQEEEQAAINNQLSMFRAFRRFLLSFVKQEQIAVVFTDLYGSTIVPKYKKPYVIDVSNPYNNYLDAVPYYFLPTFARGAQETLDRLDRCEKNPLLETEKLFDPQPNLRSLFEAPININTVITLMSVQQNSNEKLPKLIERRKTFNSTAIAKMKELMTYVLKHLYSSFSINSKEDVVEKIKKAMKQFIDRSFYQNDHEWIPTTKKHEDFDITFIFPLNTKEQHAMYISMTK